ncbi:unnamed protein product [Closterium sp. Naga37s-1]|nr:unnamed protein product [Closterium sp. Naga37s-1]
MSDLVAFFSVVWQARWAMRVRRERACCAARERASVKSQATAVDVALQSATPLPIALPLSVAQINTLASPPFLSPLLIHCTRHATQCQPKANLQTSLSFLHGPPRLLLPPLPAPCQQEGGQQGSSACLMDGRGPSLQPSSQGHNFSARPCPLFFTAPPHATSTTAPTFS